MAVVLRRRGALGVRRFRR